MPRTVVKEVRKEERDPERLRVVLSQIAEPLFTETASTENVSQHGMRVLTERFWKRGTELLVQSSNQELWGHGRVVYCQSFSHGAFATGLELLARTGDWINRSLSPQAPKWK
jgi:PilZ domain